MAVSAPSWRSIGPTFLHARAVMYRELMRRPPVAFLFVAVWLVVCFVLLMQHWPDTARTVPDADDAMRLVQVRALLAGQNWFDLHEARIFPPFGYDTHWSRLIDAGLAGVLGVLRTFADQALAERLLGVLWPLLWLLPTMAGVVAIAWRLGGREAAIVALLLVLIGEPAFQQFRPGRIDHHNVQIALSILTLAATVWANRKPWCAWAAGGLTGLALGVGLEGLPYLAGCGVALALRYAADVRAAPALRPYGLAVAGATLAAFLATVGPERWMQSACDAIAFNLVAAVMIGGLGLALLNVVRATSPMMRIATVAAVGMAALAVFAVSEPRCLRGPYAMMDPAVWTIWLDHVPEMQPLLRLFATSPLVAAAVTAFPAAALVAVLLLARERELRHDFAFLVAAATLALGAATTFVALKAFSYAMWFAMPLVAVAVVRLFAAFALTTAAARLVAGLVLTPTALSAGAVLLAEAAGFEERGGAAPQERACFAFDSYRPLARLAAGVVATNVRYGPFVLALTPHSVLAAPYHRLSAAILTNHHALAATPEEARAALLDTPATYVVICRHGSPLGFGAAERTDSLWARLQAGAVPDWLEPVAGTTGEPLLAFRIKR